MAREQRIAALMPVINDMLDRCEETVHHTSRVLLRWLRSTKPQSCYPKPFTLVALPQSKRKYHPIFKRFVAFLFRAYRLPIDFRRCHTRIRFTSIQFSQLNDIWNHRALLNPELRAQDRKSSYGHDAFAADSDSEASSDESSTVRGEEEEENYLDTAKDGESIDRQEKEGDEDSHMSRSSSSQTSRQTAIAS
jgi:hypothetical protein